MSIFNRIYHANIVTSGLRSTSKACFVKKTFSCISRVNFVICGTRTTQSQRIAYLNRIPRTIIVTKASLPAIACKARLSLHCDGIQGKRSSTSCGRVYSQSREQLFSLAGFYFYAIEFTRTAMNRHFRSQVRLSCDGKLTRNRANSNFHPQPAIVILAPIWERDLETILIQEDTTVIWDQVWLSSPWRTQRSLCRPRLAKCSHGTTVVS